MILVLPLPVQFERYVLIFTKEEDEEFMRHATPFVAPIFKLYFSGMQNVVSELLAARKIDGARVKELLRIGIPR